MRIVASFPRRGLRRIDPPTLIVSDALELARIVRESPSPAQELLVLPRTERVKWVPGAGEKWRRATGAAPLEPFGATEVDGLRPYRQGTPASRIHWPALARGAGLLERRLRADTETRPLVVLDARCDGPLEHLDAAVRAAASLVLELGRPHRLRPVAAGRVPPARDRAGPDRLAGRPCQAGAGRGRTRDEGSRARSRRPVVPGPVRRGDGASGAAARAGRRRRPRRDRRGPEGAGDPATFPGQLRGRGLRRASSSPRVAGRASTRRDHPDSGRGPGAGPQGRGAALAGSRRRPPIVRRSGSRRSARSACTACCAGGR